MENKNKNQINNNELEEMVIALPTLEYALWHSLSNFPKLEKTYLRTLERKYQRKLQKVPGYKGNQSYQNLKFIFN